MKKTKGFTLSEVLIALLVLGIIVASSVPVILKLAPNKNVAMMQKAYYMTTDVVNSLINDSYYYPDLSINCQGGLASGAVHATYGGTCYYGFDYPASVQVNSSIEANGGVARKMRCLFASKLNIKENLANVCNGNIEVVTTMDGMSWYLGGLFGNDNSYVTIDVDGIENGVHAFSRNDNKGLCNNVNTFNVTSCANDLTPRIKKNFDRIQIEIKRDGTLEIDDRQEDFLNIISGKTKVISGDDD